MEIIIKCPKCKGEMSEYWKVEFDYYPSLSNEGDETWSLIKNNIKECGYECFACNLKMLDKTELNQNP